MSQTEPLVRMAFDAGNQLGETPIWSQREQALWWVNCEHPPELHRWHPASGEHRVWPMPQRIGGFVFKADPKGGLLVALADGLYDFTPATGALALRAPSPFPAHVKLHECACDRQGRLWTGGFDTRYAGPGTSADAGYCRLDGDRLTIAVTGVHVANGLAFSPDGRTMYAVTSPTRRVEAFALDPATGELSQRRPFVDLPEGFADGAAVDAQGGYWLANVTAGALRRYLPDGRLDRTVALPFSNPTKPAFGGPELATLYVTSTRMTMPPVREPSAPNGPVYALEPGERGLPEVPFAG